MKRFILATPLGRLAMAIRDSTDLIALAMSRPEDVGTLANDHLAATLTSKLCLDEKIFLDIGAQIGSAIAGVLHHHQSIQIHAVEAFPEKAAYIHHKNSNINVHSCALGDSEGEAIFFVNHARSGYSSILRPSHAETEFTEIRVPLKTLDSLIQSDQVDFIKIDVEGAELSVLRGGERLIAASRPTIMFESGPAAEADFRFTKEALWQWFADREYAVVVPNRLAQIDLGMSQDCFLESHLYPIRTTNYFAVPRERREPVRIRARDVLQRERPRRNRQAVAPSSQPPAEPTTYRST